MEIIHVKLIVFFSLMCLSVRVSVCQAPSAGKVANSQNNRPETGKQAPQAAQERQACPKNSCPPVWIERLEFYKNYLNLLPTIMPTMCEIAKQEGFISDCSGPNLTCGDHRLDVKYCCCRASDLSRVQECLNTSTFICVPDNFDPWKHNMQKAIAKIVPMV